MPPIHIIEAKNVTPKPKSKDAVKVAIIAIEFVADPPEVTVREGGATSTTDGSAPPSAVPNSTASSSSLMLNFSPVGNGVAMGELDGFWGLSVGATVITVGA